MTELNPATADIAQASKTQAGIRVEVLQAILEERQHQLEKWGSGKEQSLPGYLTILRKEIEEAVDGWLKDREGRHSPLHEVVQVAATAIACLETYGTCGTAISTNDIPYSISKFVSTELR
jgi:hypothetical protein